MHGADTFTESPFTVHRLDDFVPRNHPLRPMRQMVNDALVKMNAMWVPTVNTQKPPAFA